MNPYVEKEKNKLNTMFGKSMTFEASGPAHSHDGWDWWYIQITDVKTNCQIGRIKYRSKGDEIQQYSWKTYDEKFFKGDPDWVSENNLRLAYYFQHGGVLFDRGIKLLLGAADQIRTERMRQRQEWRDAHPKKTKRHGLKKPSIMLLALDMIRVD